MLAGPSPGACMAQDLADTVIDEELLEFLSADLLPEAADPAFKARLREQLLAMLRAQRDLRISRRDGESD